jgi:hypothetical protein
MAAPEFEESVEISPLQRLVTLPDAVRMVQFL